MQLKTDKKMKNLLIIDAKVQLTFLLQQDFL
jgi:hypothetical protein